MKNILLNKYTVLFLGLFPTMTFSEETAQQAAKNRAIIIRDRNQEIDNAPKINSTQTVKQPTIQKPIDIPVSKPVAKVQNGIVPLDVTPSKSTYSVNESIEFNVKGKEPYYLYVFNVDAKNDQVVLLIPNDKTSNNYLRPHQTYNIPGTVEFYSDTPGTEKVIFIGTREPIDLKALKTKNLGAFKITKSADLTQAFATRAIKIRDAMDKKVVKNQSIDHQVSEGMTVIHLNIQP